MQFLPYTYLMEILTSKKTHEVAEKILQSKNNLMQSKQTDRKWKSSEIAESESDSEPIQNK